MICKNCKGSINTKQEHISLPGGLYSHTLEVDCIAAEFEDKRSFDGTCNVCGDRVYTDDDKIRTPSGLFHEACGVDASVIAVASPLENTEKTGGTRFSAGKPGHWWCAPLLGLKLVAPVWTGGAKKYAPMDWQEGQSFTTLIDCAMRHMLDMLHYGPLARCKESGHYHAAHLVWNLLALLTFVEEGRGEEMNDIDKWRGVTAARAKVLRAAADQLEGKTDDGG